MSDTLAENKFTKKFFRGNRRFTAASRKAKVLAEAQQKEIAGQKQKESLRLSEASSDVARRKLTGRAGGRTLLTRTSSRGVTDQLGG